MKTFTDLYKIEVRHLLQKKGRHDYLPWAIALRLACEADPAFTYSPVEDQLGSKFFPATPGSKTGSVKVKATMFGRTLTESLAVMDGRNQAIENPDATDIENSSKRCLVKVIACFGLGLSAWSREFPEPEVVDHTSEVEPPTGWTWETVTSHCKAEGWPAPQTLNKERLVALVTHFTDKIGVGFDDL